MTKTATIADFDATSSLNAMWVAYQRSRAKGGKTSSRHRTHRHTIVLVLVCNPGNLKKVSGEGVSASITTTYGYDANGNLLSKITGATTTSYVYDYLNRLIASRTTGASATTTYGYDWQGNRVFQQTGSTTTLYPSKYYSLVSTVVGSTTQATSTEYAFAGDTLLATIDTPSTTVGTTTTTGTSTTTYIHPDNLGSTQATSDATGHLSQYFIYAPYGSVLASTNISSDNGRIMGTVTIFTCYD